MVVNKVALLATAGLLVSGLAAPQVASAKTVTIKINGKGNPKNFPDVTAKLTGTLGSGMQSKCCVKLPTMSMTWTFGGKYKGGLKVTTAPTLKGTISSGSWKVRKGSTGKFKGATGGGKVSMDITDGTYVWTGKIKLK